MKEQYKIRNVYFIGHNNGRIFGLLLALYTPDIFTTIVTHTCSIGFDTELYLNYLVLTKNFFYTEKEDLYKETRESARKIFLREGFAIANIFVENEIVSNTYQHVNLIY
jgi:hypothetical protein